MNPHDLFGNDFNAFSEIDPFNPQNTVEGFISRKPNEYYGALILTKINGQDTEQLILGVPKIHYPFDSLQDGTRRYKFPIVKDIEIYEKLDGTSVVSYVYTNGSSEFLTHKLRLRPFMANSKFGNFLDMWREIASNYFSTILCLINKHNCNLAFEMYGSRNTHLILYKNALDLALLFGVSHSGRILSPTDLGITNELPVVPKLYEIDRDYVKHYEAIQQELESKLHKVENEEQYTGIEGTVWYLGLLEGRRLQIKCKPTSVEAIHFATGGLSKNTIIATCWNAFENVDTLTLEFVKQLLLEEYDADKIEANIELIQKCMDLVTNEMEFRQQVLSEYKKLGINVLLNKQEVMRSLSERFDKNKMRKVYALIVAYS